jgi:hypothetical protein
MQEKKKISQLTPKERALDSTDLFMISEVAPDGYATKSITGAEILQSIPVVETNPTTLASGTGLNVTGNTVQVSASVLIPAGTLTTNKVLYIRNILTKSAGSTTSTGRVYLNTTNDLTGSTLLGISAGMNSTTYIQRFERNFLFDGTNLLAYNPNGLISTDLTAGTLTNVPFNSMVDNYLLFAVLNSTTTPDNLGHKKYIVQIYD